MKRLFAALLMVFACAASAANHTYGTHGMALFGGKDGLYASHLPIFHPPHDYQVIFRFHLADPRQDSDLRERLDGKTYLWTIDPEKFELDRLAPGAANPLREFSAKIVLGHFEQGGLPVFKDARVMVDTVLMFRQLSTQMQQADTVRYQPVGKQFLVKEVDSRPDFDHIVLLKEVATGAAAQAVTVPRHGLDVPAREAIQAASGRQVVGTIYYYTEDLK